MAEAAVSFLAEQLASVVKELIFGVEDELQKLMEEVEVLKAFLRDAGGNMSAERLSDLERQMKEVVYDVEDTMDSSKISMAAAKDSNVVFRALLITVIGQARARAIQSIRNRKLEPISRTLRTYRDRLRSLPPDLSSEANRVKSNSRLLSFRTISPLIFIKQSVTSVAIMLLHSIHKLGSEWIEYLLPSHFRSCLNRDGRGLMIIRGGKEYRVPSEQQDREVPMILPTNFVGFEDEAETLIRSLTREMEELDVIAITGMPGIGKTALASKIYQDHRIQDVFPTRIWVGNIPSNFRSKDLFLSILKQGLIAQESCSDNSSAEILNETSEINDDELNKAAIDYLKKSRYLLVMDDVWDPNSLSNVVVMLPKKGKVLITSCDKHIIEKQSTLDLPFLNERESWELLQLEVFGKLHECDDMLKPTGELIAKNCEGSPLAIVAAASSLVVSSSTKAAKDLTKKWWEAVSENVTTYLTDYGQHCVFSSVELSYTKLSPRTRNCFLYLGVFPQGREIDVRTLVRLWVAEGLVYDYTAETSEETSDTAQQNMEETAQQILKDLVGKNLVMVYKTYPNGQITACRLHKMIHRFCKHKAAVRDIYQEIKMPLSSDLTPAPRRLCMNSSSLSEFLSSMSNERRIRSILCLDGEEENKVILHAKESSAISKRFELLKVLECKNINFTKFPSTLSKLMNLSYISISCDDDPVVIPKAISSLRFLETLVVGTKSHSLNIKANIWKMLKLRHLVTKAVILLPAIQGKGEAGKDLQTVARLAPECCTKDMLKRTPNLRTLGIRGNIAALSSPESLRELEHLENLKLVNESGAGIQLQPQLFPPNLKWLTLSGTYLEWKSMSILGKIESLEILKLKNNAFVGESWTSTDANGFRGLVFLSIRTTNLVSWEASEDSFPRLKCLVLRNCEDLCTIPSTLAKSLDTVDVEEKVSESAVECCNEIKRSIARRQGQANV